MIESSRVIYIFISSIWNYMLASSDILSLFIMAPLFINRVAASGTVNTLNPVLCSNVCNFAIAVVFPAHGPPVRHILNNGAFFSGEATFLCLMIFMSLFYYSLRLGLTFSWSKMTATPPVFKFSISCIIIITKTWIKIFLKINDEMAANYKTIYFKKSIRL